MYADQYILDFVVSFSYTTIDASGNLGSFTIKSSALINAYTLSSTYLTNVKVSYVNYYGHTNNINKG